VRWTENIRENSLLPGKLVSKDQFVMFGNWKILIGEQDPRAALSKRDPVREETLKRNSH